MELPYENAKRITFKRRKVPISPENRPIVKMAQLTLVCI